MTKSTKYARRPQRDRAPVSRLDLLVEDCIVIEIKSIDALASIHTAQLLTYLRFSKVAWSFDRRNRRDRTALFVSFVHPLCSL
ncbi:GxxExxY protein [Brevundimonas sp.]|uniref:GxxExxY protein n=1 Tax=Brevundimonas sp. TaxID=1871086 RepID=UPI002579A524|nr:MULTISPECIES: GxxExxY protein [unclassified Brevundimonas]